MSDMNILEELFSLKGKTGIVTGASSGLGLEMSRTLALAGAKVFALSRSGKVKVDTDEPLPDTVEHIAADVTDYDRIGKIIDHIGKEHGIDFLVNNAGITNRTPAQEYDMKDFDKIVNINVDAVFNLCKACYPYLKKAQGGSSIVSISSMAAHLGFSEVVPYSATKSAITGMTRGLAIEWAGDNIRVNSVAPGWFPSGMLKQILDDERKKKILNRMPMHRFGKPKELAAMILFLVSPAASYITGQDIAVDGGALAFGY